MDHEITIRTDTATLAVFDPEVLAGRLDDDADWWCTGSPAPEEVRRGDFALFGLGGDGVFTVRVTDGGLLPAERAYASDHFALGVVVRSASLFVGPAEFVPAEEFQVVLVAKRTAGEE